MAGLLQVVVGAQFGSESKGRVAAWLLEKVDGPQIAVRVGGGNAGHTVYGTCPPDCDHMPRKHLTDQHPWRLRHVPVAAVTNPDAQLVLAAGSEIDPAVLRLEVATLEGAGYKVRDRLFVDGQATVVEPRHQQAESESNLAGVLTWKDGGESLTSRIGSTGKGIGAARADRALRRAALWRDWATAYGAPGTVAEDSSVLLRQALRGDHAQVVIEGVQGYGLGQHAGYYPYVTSSDCRAVDFLSMAGLSPWDRGVAAFEVWAVARTRPIRVAGNSGPLLGETSWGELGLPDEYTTVTQKVRRVGDWDPTLVIKALEANGGVNRVKLAMTMLDQVFPAAAGVTEFDQLPTEAQRWLYRVEAEVGQLPLFIGTGPHSHIGRR